MLFAQVKRNHDVPKKIPINISMTLNCQNSQSMLVMNISGSTQIQQYHVFYTLSEKHTQCF